ncbi:hypothetical protein ACFL0Q_08445 [Thermodesulfobacteriota bacterium]
MADLDKTGHFARICFFLRDRLVFSLFMSHTPQWPVPAIVSSRDARAWGSGPWMSPAFLSGSPTVEYDHMVLLVRLDHEYLVDVGNGQSCKEPLRIDGTNHA